MIVTIDDALQAFPNEGEWLCPAYINQGMYLTEIGELVKAEDVLVRATRRFPEEKKGWLNLGNLYLAKNQLRRAKNRFRKALELDAGYPHAKYGLARIAIRQENDDACLKLLEEIFSCNRQFVTRVRLEREFADFRETEQYSELLNKLSLSNAC